MSAMAVSSHMRFASFVYSVMLFAFCLFAAGSCQDKQGDSGNSANRESKSAAGENPVIIATIPPLAMILREIAGQEFEVLCLLPPGASPHTYEPSPSDAKMAAKASALFYVGEGLDDWAAKIETRIRVEVFQFVPDEFKLEFEDTHDLDDGEHNHSDGHGHAKGGFDPHFWTSPKVVIPVSIALCGELASQKPNARPNLRENLKRFELSLLELDAEIRDLMSGFAGESVVLLHASQNYLLSEYGIKIAGIIEEAAGVEASPRKIAELADQIRQSKAKAIFTEPQLSESAARTIANEAGVPLFELDPLGGTSGRDTYENLIRFNASALAEALSGKQQVGL